MEVLVLHTQHQLLQAQIVHRSLSPQLVMMELGAPFRIQMLHVLLVVLHRAHVVWQLMLHRVPHIQRLLRLGLVLQLDGYQFVTMEVGFQHHTAMLRVLLVV